MPGLLDILEFLNSGASVGTRLKMLDMANRGGIANPEVRKGLLPTPEEITTNPTVNDASGFLGPMAAAKLGGLLGAGVMTYHGTPHKFDKYDLSKIGTGEGAQVYGHGIYLAENPKTAAFYKTSLTPPRFAEAQKINEMLPAAHQGTADNAYRVLTDIQDAMTRGDITSPKDYLKVFDVSKELRPAYERAQQIVAGKGALYKQDLPDEVLPKMLHWDKPLTEHPAEIRNAVVPAVQRAMNEGWTSLKDISKAKGEDAWAAFQMAADVPGTNWANAGPLAAQNLRSLGIPGISYLDQGSRKAAHGTRNHVIWDQELLNRMLPQVVE